MPRLKGHKSNGRGTPQIDRAFPQPVGEIRRASGTHDPQAYRDIDDMLTALCRSVPPRWDVLVAIRDRRIEPLHALSLWRMNRLSEIPTVEMLPPLQQEVERWIANLEHGDDYKAQIKSTFNKLYELSSEASVGDVVELLQLRRNVCKEANHPVSFNRNKAHVQSFVRDLLGDDHQLYKLVTRIDTLDVGEPLRQAQTPEKLAYMLSCLPEPHLSMAWSLAVTGMRPKEYFSRQWGHAGAGMHATSIVIHGTKRAARRRTVPLWATGLPTMPQRSRDAFEGMWDRRFDGALGIYDLRRSFAVWMEDANIPRSRRKIYLGHSAGDVTGLYETRELDAWRKDDGARLAEYAGEYVPGFTPTPMLQIA